MDYIGLNPGKSSITAHRAKGENHHARPTGISTRSQPSLKPRFFCAAQAASTIFGNPSARKIPAAQSGR
jgi:hypothetical protein